MFYLKSTFLIKNTMKRSENHFSFFGKSLNSKFNLFDKVHFRFW